MDLLETRELRYFVTVADELHFGRAAQRLMIAQPALSRAIQRIEGRLGVALFTRSSRNVELTAAGRALLDSGRHALRAVELAAQEAQRAGEHEPLRLVLKPGGDANLLSDILAAHAACTDAQQVDILFSGGTDRADYLRDGRADIALLYVPFDDVSGITYETLRVEDRVAVLPMSHRLARRSEIHRADLDGETFPRWVGLPETETGTGPRISDVTELIPLVTIGRMIAVLPRSLITPQPAGLVCIPVCDAEPSRIVIARLTRDSRHSVDHFMQAAVHAVHALAPAKAAQR